MEEDEIPELLDDSLPVEQENNDKKTVSQKKVPVTIITGFLGSGKVKNQLKFTQYFELKTYFYQ